MTTNTQTGNETIKTTGRGLRWTNCWFPGGRWPFWRAIDVRLMPAFLERAEVSVQNRNLSGAPRERRPSK